jgi:hypothetical protein
MSTQLGSGCCFTYLKVNRAPHNYPDVCFVFFLCTMYGGFVGYFCGILVAAVFLLIDKWKSHLADLRLREKED